MKERQEEVERRREEGGASHWGGPERGGGAPGLRGRCCSAFSAVLATEHILVPGSEDSTAGLTRSLCHSHRTAQPHACSVP